MTGNGPQTPAQALAPEARDLQPTLNPAYRPPSELEDPGKEQGPPPRPLKKRPQISSGKTPDRATKIFKGTEGGVYNLAPIPIGRLAFRERPKTTLTNQGTATHRGLLGPSSLSTSFLKAAQKLTKQGEEAIQLDEILSKAATKWERAGYTELTRLIARLRNEVAAFSRELISGILREPP